MRLLKVRLLSVQAPPAIVFHPSGEPPATAPPRRISPPPRAANPSTAFRESSGSAVKPERWRRRASRSRSPAASSAASRAATPRDFSRGTSSPATPAASEWTPTRREASWASIGAAHSSTSTGSKVLMGDPQCAERPQVANPVPDILLKSLNDNELHRHLATMLTPAVTGYDVTVTLDTGPRGMSFDDIDRVGIPMEARSGLEIEVKPDADAADPVGEELPIRIVPLVVLQEKLGAPARPIVLGEFQARPDRKVDVPRGLLVLLEMDRHDRRERLAEREDALPPFQPLQGPPRLQVGGHRMDDRRRSRVEAHGSVVGSRRRQGLVAEVQILLPRLDDERIAQVGALMKEGGLRGERAAAIVQGEPDAVVGIDELVRRAVQVEEGIHDRLEPRAEAFIRSGIVFEDGEAFAERDPSRVGEVGVAGSGHAAVGSGEFGPARIGDQRIENPVIGQNAPSAPLFGGGGRILQIVRPGLPRGRHRERQRRPPDGSHVHSSPPASEAL